MTSSIGMGSCRTTRSLADSNPSPQDPLITDIALILRAAQFAADRHRSQHRKDGATPYINHPLRVAAALAECGVTDIDLLVAAVLHDTVEDTDTTPQELAERFGAPVRDLVMEVTDDKALSKEERKRLKVETAGRMSPSARMLKLADMLCNVEDVTHAPATGWSLARRQEYLTWTEQVAAACRGCSAALEAHFDEAVRVGRVVLTEGSLAGRGTEDPSLRSG